MKVVKLSQNRFNYNGLLRPKIFRTICEKSNKVYQRIFREIRQITWEDDALKDIIIKYNILKRLK